MKRSSVVVMSIASLFLGVAVVLSNCGGGGGGGGGNNLPSIALKTDNVRIEQPNDSWTYSVSGNIVSGGTTYSLTGTQTTLILTSTKTAPGGHACKVEYSSTSLVVNSNPEAPFSQYTYFEQDAAGNNYKYGEGDGSTDKWITSPAAGYVLDTKSPVSIGDNYSYTVTFSNGDTQTFSATVIGKEYVTTGVANYESYKATMSQTTNYVSGSYTKEVLTGTVWIVPGLEMVKQEMNVKRYIGSSLDNEINVTFTLASTNIAY